MRLINKEVTLLAVADMPLGPTAASAREGAVSSVGDDLPPDILVLLPNVSFHFDCFFEMVDAAGMGTGATMEDPEAGRVETLSRGLSVAPIPDVREVRLISRASCCA